MSLRTARVLTTAYFTAATIALTWPGLVPFAKIRPFILGLPLSMAWIAAWIAGAVVVLYLLDRVERRYRSPDDDEGHATPAAGTHPDAGPDPDAGHGSAV